jgi:hypothetical protein
MASIHVGGIREATILAGRPDSDQVLILPASVLEEAPCGRASPASNDAAANKRRNFSRLCKNACG